MSANPYAPPLAGVHDVVAPVSGTEVEFELRTLDLLLFNWVHVLASKGHHAFFAVLAGALAIPGVEQSDAHGVVRVLSTAFVWLAFWLILWMTMLVIVAVMVLLKRNRWLLARHVVAVQADGFHKRSDDALLTVFWPGVRKVVSRPGFVVVYTGASGAQLIPARAFATLTQRDEFFRYARDRVAQSRDVR